MAKQNKTKQPGYPSLACKVCGGEALLFKDATYGNHYLIACVSGDCAARPVTDTYFNPQGCISDWEEGRTE